MRQLLTESVMLAGFGAILGTVFAFWGCRVLLALLSSRTDVVYLDVSPDLRVLAFTALVAIATGVLFGAGPALRATRTGTAASLKESSRTVSRRPVAVRMLVVSQVALCLLLLIGAGLFVRTFWNLTHQNLGYNARGLYVAELDPRSVGYKEESLAGLYAELLRNLNRDPRIRAASLSSLTPIGYCCWGGPLAAEGVAGETASVFLNNVSPGFFPTFGTRLLAGRDFTESDGPAGPDVAIISDSLAKRYYAGTNPIGKHFRLSHQKGHQNAEIIGVVEDMRNRRLRAGTQYEVYFNLFHAEKPKEVIVEVRAAGRSSAEAVLRRHIQAIDRQIPVNAESLEEQIGQFALRERMTAVLAGFFGALSLLLACIGLYGVMSYTVIRRTAELGIRMALGARSRQVTWMIVREAVSLTALGAVIGIPTAIWCSRTVKPLSGLLFGLEPTDPATIAAVTVLLIALATVAALLPARRAARLDPVKALRTE